MVGIAGALVGGFLAATFLKTHPFDGPLDLSSIVTATIGAVVVVLVVDAISGRLAGRRPSL